MREVRICEDVNFHFLSTQESDIIILYKTV